jgi:hypothetical protein
LDKSIHEHIVNRFPKALPTIDKFLEQGFGIISHPAFAIIVALLLVVLVATNIISRIVAESIFGAWAVALIWIARSNRTKNLTVVSRLIVVSIIGIALGLAGSHLGAWAVNNYNEQAAVVKNPEQKSSVGCKVEAVIFEPYYRFFQPRPVYFQRLDSALRVSLTNQTGKPLYIRSHSVAGLKGVVWVPFTNADSGASDPYAFGVMTENQLARFDLKRV